MVNQIKFGIVLAILALLSACQIAAPDTVSVQPLSAGKYELRYESGDLETRQEIDNAFAAKVAKICDGRYTRAGEQDIGSKHHQCIIACTKAN
ncbi:MAG: hypothetical protein VW169_13445 [Rhodospirillaceae bacterium]